MARALKLVVAALKAERAVILHPPTAARIVLAKRPTRVTRTVARTALLATVRWTVDGPILVRALKLVAEGFRAEIAAILRLPMAARIV